MDYGAFKQTLDSGLELRRSAFDFADILLTHPTTTLGISICEEDVEKIIQAVIRGLGDNNYDVKTLAQETIRRVCGESVMNGGRNVLKHGTEICEALLETMWKTVPATAVKHEIEQNDDCIKSAMKVVKAMEDVLEIESCAKFLEIKKEIYEDDILNKMWKALFGGTSGLVVIS